jgi:hypothetical protein
MVAVNAASSDPSSFVSITPTRILDTRTDVGLEGPFESGESQTLQVTGTVATQPPNKAPAVNAVAVPENATSVVFNVTAVAPATKGFLAIRSGDATGIPPTSNINWAAGGPNTANSVTVQLPANGTINIFVNGTVGQVLIDVAGYYVPGSGAPGPTGQTGPAGPVNIAFARDTISNSVLSTSYVNQISLTANVTEGQELLIEWTGEIRCRNTRIASCAMKFTVDGVGTQMGSTLPIAKTDETYSLGSFSDVVENLSAGTHTIALQAKKSLSADPTWSLDTQLLTATPFGG